MKRISGEDRAGLYITVIFHLVVLIVLLAAQIGAALQKEDTFLLDFSKQEAVRKEQEQAVFKEDIREKLDRLLAAASATPVRNVAVDRSTMLKDDRNTDAEELYKEAERLAEELDKKFSVEENDDYVAIEKKTVRQAKPKQETYTGPSVVSYDLAGRKASRLSIPAYRCLGAGYVTVIITVTPSGDVVNAKIQDDVSSDDACLRNFAIRAARMSRFSASTSAPARQVGNIVYMFIAQ